MIVYSLHETLSLLTSINGDVKITFTYPNGASHTITGNRDAVEVSLRLIHKALGGQTVQDVQVTSDPHVTVASSDQSVTQDLS